MIFKTFHSSLIDYAFSAKMNFAFFTEKETSGSTFGIEITIRFI
jgi:hypothetical protein